MNNVKAELDYHKQLNPHHIFTHGVTQATGWWFTLHQLQAVAPDIPQAPPSFAVFL